MTRHANLDIAVIGTGIAGMSAAWLLSQAHRVTVYEQSDRPGGHSNTVHVPTPDGPIAVDTGFIVYNENTYPNLTALFRRLGVATRPSEMSFAVSLRDGALEYAGTDLFGLFAQPGNLVSPRFWRMFSDILRFYREAPNALDDASITLRAWLDARGYSDALIEDHLLPMAAAIWSTPAAETGDLPAATFLQFCHNHGLLRLRDRPVWRTVAGGSRCYVERLTAPFANDIRLGCGVRSLRRFPDHVLLTDATGARRRYDQVVVASHPDQALAMLADPTEAEATLLGAFRYRPNDAVLHTDPSLMPRRRRAWSSWNYLGGDGAGGPSITYWMNHLQGLQTPWPLFVSLNPPRPPAPECVLHRETYAHPQIDAAATAAQRNLWSLQGVRRTWFCGAWFGAGFHEDGLQAGLGVAEQLGGVRRPWSVPNESGRIHVGATPVIIELAA
jgi:predicted NAD/FAD-binding protein